VQYLDYWQLFVMREKNKVCEKNKILYMNARVTNNCLLLEKYNTLNLLERENAWIKWIY